MGCAFLCRPHVTLCHQGGQFCAICLLNKVDSRIVCFTILFTTDRLELAVLSKFQLVPPAPVAVPPPIPAAAGVAGTVVEVGIFLNLKICATCADIWPREQIQL